MAVVAMKIYCRILGAVSTALFLSATASSQEGAGECSTQPEVSLLQGAPLTEDVAATGAIHESAPATTTEGVSLLQKPAKLSGKAVLEDGGNPHLINLRRESVPIYRRGKVASFKTSYSGILHVGNPPQEFRVVFDTGSAHVVLPAAECKSESCLVHRRYNMSSSRTSLPINTDGSVVPAGELCDQVTIGFGTGQITGEFVKDTVCFNLPDEYVTKATADNEIRVAIELEAKAKEEAEAAARAAAEAAAAPPAEAAEPCPAACHSHKEVHENGVCTLCLSSWGWCGSTSSHCENGGTDCSLCKAKEAEGADTRPAPSNSEASSAATASADPQVAPPDDSEAIGATAGPDAPAAMGDTIAMSQTETELVSHLAEAGAWTEAGAEGALPEASNSLADGAEPSAVEPLAVEADVAVEQAGEPFLEAVDDSPTQISPPLPDFRSEAEKTADAERIRVEHPLGVLCVDMHVVLAVEMSTQPFKSFLFDGILGLSLDGLALNEKFSAFDMLIGGAKLERPHFGVFLTEGEDGEDNEIAFGGHNVDRTLEPLSWAPVVMAEMGYWQVKIVAVRINGVELAVCKDGTCRGVVDTGTSHLGIPAPFDAEVADLLTVNSGELKDCRLAESPAIEIEVEGYNLTLQPFNYMRRLPLREGVTVGSKQGVYVPSNETNATLEGRSSADAVPVANATSNGSDGNASIDVAMIGTTASKDNVSVDATSANANVTSNSTSNGTAEEDGEVRRYCRPRLMPVRLPEPLGPKLFILGEPVLHRYYTVFDWSQKKVAFSLANNRRNTMSAEELQALRNAGGELPKEVDMLLMQTSGHTERSRRTVTRI